MRFTLGQTPDFARRYPATSARPPATTSHTTFSILFLFPFSHSPAKSPRIIVPSVGMKLSVAYPPPLVLKGSPCPRTLGISRTKRSSNAHARLLFLFQCAAKPSNPCVFSQSADTPTAAYSKSGPGSGYQANAPQYP